MNMKRKIVFVAMFGMILAFGLVFMGCETMEDFASGYNSGDSGGSSRSQSEQRYNVMLHVQSNTQGYDYPATVYATSASQAIALAKREFLSSHPGFTVTNAFVY